MEPGGTVSEPRTRDADRVEKDRSKLNPRRESNAVYLKFGELTIDRLSRTWLKEHSPLFAEYFADVERLGSTFWLPFLLSTKTWLRIFDHELAELPFLGKVEAMIFYKLYEFDDLSSRCADLIIWHDVDDIDIAEIVEKLSEWCRLLDQILPAALELYPRLDANIDSCMRTLWIVMPTQIRDAWAENLDRLSTVRMVEQYRVVQVSEWATVSRTRKAKTLRKLLEDLPSRATLLERVRAPRAART